MLVVMNPVMLAKNRMRLTVLGEYGYSIDANGWFYVCIVAGRRKDSFIGITNHFPYSSGMHIYTMSVKLLIYFWTLQLLLTWFVFTLLTTFNIAVHFWCTRQNWRMQLIWEQMTVAHGRITVIVAVMEEEVSIAARGKNVKSVIMAQGQYLLTRTYFIH